MYLAASLHKKTAASPISSTVPNRFNGIVCSIFSFATGRQATHTLGLIDRARRYTIDANPQRAPFDREVTSHRVYSGFRGTGVGLHGNARIVQRRGDVQDMAAIVSQTLFKGYPRHVVGALSIDLHDRSKALRGQHGRR